jgi:predicted Zn-dependent peptidase
MLPHRCQERVEQQGIATRGFDNRTLAGVEHRDTLAVTLNAMPPAERVDDVLGIIASEADHLRRNGLSPEELRALIALARRKPHALQQPGNRLYNLSCAIWEPYRLDWPDRVTTELEALTVTEINALARTLFAPERCLRIIARPEP